MTRIACKLGTARHPRRNSRAQNVLPYGRQSIDEEDIQAVVDVLRSDWLTTGPKVAEFEEAFAARVGAKYAVSFSSGTAALHGAAFAAGLKAGDEAITSPLTFAATANCVLYQGALPVFADVSRRYSESRSRSPGRAHHAQHARHSAGGLRRASRRSRSHSRTWPSVTGSVVIEDACHALGAEYKGRRVGSIAHMTVFSFHPVKHITTGEGGMVTTDDADLAETLRRFRNHGISSDAPQAPEQPGSGTTKWCCWVSTTG